MNRPSRGRRYLRKTRKLACQYCNSRHIRCRTPDTALAADGLPPVGCKACLDANEICDIQRAKKQLGPRPAPTYTSTKPPTHSHINPARHHLAARRHLPPADNSPLVRLVESQIDGKESTDRGRSVICFGEHSSYSYIIQVAVSPVNKPMSSPLSTLKMHYRIPDPTNESTHDVHNSIRDEFGSPYAGPAGGSATSPQRAVQRALLDCFFRWMHPSQQIFDQFDFVQKYESRRVSPLLLQAVFFTGAIYCDESLIEEHYGTRHAAQMSFFKSARALYDSDLESDIVATIQSLYLMSFMWASPTEQKEFGHWLGAAIRIAQSRGMHRSTKNASMHPKQRRLWKRIWWALYVRDRSDAAALGRPAQIHDDDCDVEMLDERDFESPSDLVAFNSPSRIHTLYAIEMAKLSVIVGIVIKPCRTSEFNVFTDTYRASIAARLFAWERQIPADLTYDSAQGSTSDSKYWAAMLHIHYNHCLILLNRPAYVETDLHKENGAVSAATKITRIVEDLLADDRICYSQVYIIPSLFAALTIHIMGMRRSEGLQRTLVLHRVKVCMLALSQLKDAWPLAAWISRLFETVMAKINEADRNVENDRAPSANAGSVGTSAAEEDDFEFPTVEQNNFILQPHASEWNSRNGNLEFNMFGQLGSVFWGNTGNQALYSDTTFPNLEPFDESFEDVAVQGS